MAAEHQMNATSCFRQRTRAALCSAVLVASCGPPGDTAEPGDCKAVPTAIEVGTGAERFEPLADGDNLMIHQGVQGLYHVLGSFLTSGIVTGDPADHADPNNPVVSFSVHTREGWVGGYADVSRPLTEIDELHLGVLGDILLLDISSFEQLDDAHASLRVELRDVCGHEVQDEREVWLRAP